MIRMSTPLIRPLVRGLLVFVLAYSQSALAEDYLWGYQVGARIGVLGAGIEVSKAISPSSVIRLNWQTFEYDEAQSDVEVAFGETLHLESAGLYWDWHPWYNGFRTTVGLVANDNFIDGVKVNDQSLTINGRTYQPTQVSGLSYEADFRNVSVYLGLGWSLAPGHYKKWAFTLDSGFFLQRRVRVDLVSLNSTPSTDPQLALDLGVLEDSLAESLENLWILPSLMFGVVRSF